LNDTKALEVSCAVWLKEKEADMNQLFDAIESRRWPRVFFGFGVVWVSLGTLVGSIAAQTSMQNPPGVIRGITDQGFAYMTGGVGSGEREIMDSWARAYNLKLAFAEMSGVYVSDVALSIEKDGRQLVRATSNGPWFYIKLPPGKYAIKATYEDTTKQINNLQLAETNRVTRFMHWNSEKERDESND
jgi:hypothetical protein